MSFVGNEERALPDAWRHESRCSEGQQERVEARAAICGILGATKAASRDDARSEDDRCIGGYPQLQGCVASTPLDDTPSLCSATEDGFVRAGPSECEDSFVLQSTRSRARMDPRPGRRTTTCLRASFALLAYHRAAKRRLDRNRSKEGQTAPFQIIAGLANSGQPQKQS